MIRAFIAIELSAELRARLGVFIARLRDTCQVSARWVDPAGVHLTLKFLGDMAPDAVPAITRAIEAAAAGIAPFRLRTEATGVFPHIGGAQVAWLGLGGDTEPVFELHRRLDEKLAPLGFNPEARAFTPHLTLARLSREIAPASRPVFGEAVCGAVMAPGIVEVTAISLKQSQLSGHGATYHRLSSVKLAGGSA